jgi:hypothetical protein
MAGAKGFPGLAGDDEIAFAQVLMAWRIVW